jgi:hypothetical protein
VIYPLFGSHNSSTTPTNAAVRYIPFVNGSAVLYTVEAQAVQIVSEAMTLSSFIVTLQVAPGSGTSWNLTVMKNGVATAMSVTVANTATTGSYTATTISFAAGDTMSVQVTPTNTPGFSSGMSWNAIADSTNQVVLGKSNAAFTNANNYIPLSGTGGSGTSTTEVVETMVMPTAGTFSNLYAAVNAAPGVGTSRIFTLYKNGVAQTITATISGTATTANDTTHTVSVVAGDTVSMNVNFTGVPASAFPQWGLSFAPTVAGESWYGVWPGAPLDTTLPSYGLIPHKVSFVTVDDFNTRGVIGAWRFKNIYIKTLTASGAAKSYTGVLRKNVADTSLSVTATNTTTAQGATSTVDIAQGDLINIAVTPNSTPTASRVPVSFTVVAIPIVVTPGTASLTTTAYAPTLNLTVTPSTASLSITPFIASVVATDNKTVVPGSTNLTTTSFAPIVSATANQIVTPDVANLILTSFVPTIETSANIIVIPNTASLTTTSFLPSVNVTNNVITSPNTIDLILSSFQPSVTITNNIAVSPSTLDLIVTAFEPTVTGSVDIVITPDTASLTLTGFAPKVTHSVSSRSYYIDTNGNIYWVINQDVGLIEKV